MACLIWQIAPQTHTQMMGYVIKSENKLTVIDGGTAGDAPYLMHLLRRVGGPRPCVDTWFITHPHSDHAGAFLRLMEEQPNEIEVQNVRLRFPARNLLERGEPGALPVWDRYDALRPLIGPREQLLRENDTLSIGQAQWEVLYVTDPTIVKNASNNSSAVLRMTAEGQSVLFLGDLGVEGGERLLAHWGGSLKSDIVQMAHHGQSAVKMDVYEAVRPSLCLWCTPKWLWDNNQGNRGYDSGQWDILHVRRKMAALQVRRHVVAKDGTFLITLSHGQADVVCVDPFAAQ